MMHKFSYQHNIEHNRSNIRALHPKIIGKVYLEPNYIAMLIQSLKIIKSYIVVMGIILSKIGIFEHYSKI